MGRNVATVVYDTINVSVQNSQIVLTESSNWKSNVLISGTSGAHVWVEGGRGGVGGACVEGSDRSLMTVEGIEWTVQGQ